MGTEVAEKEGQGNDDEDEVIIHEGVKYTRVVIEGLGEDTDYLMTDEGDIFTLDFRHVTNMNDP